MTFFSGMRHKYPDIVDDKIDTNEFLEASREVVQLVELLGKVFAPVTYDMRNNIEKLDSVFSLNRTENKYIQDMLLLERSRNSYKANISLLWLRRALHMTLHLFKCLVEDYKTGTRSDSLDGYLREAYLNTLEPYHGWMTQKLFHIISRLCPSRDQFFGYLANGRPEAEVVADMDRFNERLQDCIHCLVRFYLDNGFETNNRV